VRNKLSLILGLCAVFFVTTAFDAKPPALFKKCQVCHGKQLTGKKKNPSIVDASYEELYAALTTDVPKKMKRVARKLTEKQKATLSAYIAYVFGGKKQ
jgi:cytochrome c553